MVGAVLQRFQSIAARQRGTSGFPDRVMNQKKNMQFADYHELGTWKINVTMEETLQ